MQLPPSIIFLGESFGGHSLLLRYKSRSGQVTEAFFFFSYFFLLCCLSGNGSFHSGEEPVRTVSSVTSDTVLPLRNHTWSCLFWAFCSPSVTAPVLKLGSRLLHLIAGRLGNFCISQCSETKLFQNSSHAVLIPFHKGTKVCCLYSTFFSSQNS